MANGNSNLKQLRTFNQVVRALDGPTEMARAIRRTPQALCNWRGRGYFPAVLSKKIQKKLRRRGFAAVDKVLGLEA